MTLLIEVIKDTKHFLDDPDRNCINSNDPRCERFRERLVATEVLRGLPPEAITSHFAGNGVGAEASRRAALRGPR